MNKVDILYPEDYTDEDKAEYDMLMSMGQNSIGTTIDKNQAFLIDLAVKMTIREKKGGVKNLSPEEVEKLRAVHNEHLKLGLIHSTPPDIWYESAMNPLASPYIPDEVQKDIDAEEEKIKENWVKLSAPLTPLTSNIENETAD